MIPIRREADIPTPATLRERERVILDMMCDGFSRKRIALELGLSTSTVQTYQKVIYTAFGVRSALQLVSKAFRSGFIPIDPS